MLILLDMLTIDMLSYYFSCLGVYECGLFLPLSFGDLKPGVAFDETLWPLNENDFHDLEVIVFVCYGLTISVMMCLMSWFPSSFRCFL